jgi:trans-2,3-dihydro-3-hydroxyanthranilate isomerase
VTVPRLVPFYLVDVFATSPMTGNPVAVVPDADQLTDTEMHAIAREFNQSETSFLLRPRRPAADWRLRSFTPTGAEVFGAGHNALGSWLWLAASGRAAPIDPSATFSQEIGDDILPVRVERDADGTLVVSMVQSPPDFGPSLADRSALADALGLREDELSSAAAQVVSTGAGHLMVGVDNRHTVDRAGPNPSALKALLASVGGEGCYIYALDGATNQRTDAYARFFNPTMGIAEDPATGTAAGPLAALLVHRGAVPEGTVFIEQGHALGRPSRIQVSVLGTTVTVAGSGLIGASGVLYL